MSMTTTGSTTTAPTQLLQAGNEKYAYRRFGRGSGRPIAASRPGAQPSLPTAAELEEMLAR
jgi:hypothetical protein